MWSATHTADGSSFIIAYAMKQQRALSLAERGFFPLVPADGLCFLPLDLGQDLPSQLRSPLHAILHKVSMWLRNEHCILQIFDDSCTKPPLA